MGNGEIEKWGAGNYKLVRELIKTVYSLVPRLVKQSSRVYLHVAQVLFVKGEGLSLTDAIFFLLF